jgi:hypothetical protein
MSRTSAWRVHALLMSLALIAGCTAQPSRPDPNPQPDHGPPGDFATGQMTGDADYYALLTTVNSPESAHYYEDRWADCSIMGYAKGKIVTITDPQTGRTQPFQLWVEDVRIPFEGQGRVKIVNKDGAAEKIELVCTAAVYSGDSFHLEVVTQAGGLAPMIGGIEFTEAPQGEDPERLFALTVSATIVTTS